MNRNTGVSQVTHLLKTKLSLSSLQTVNQSPGGSKCQFGALVYISCYDVSPSSFVLGGERTMKKSPSVKRQDGFFHGLPPSCGIMVPRTPLRTDPTMH